eukprot:maker-scaffold870_size86522-snap-gene-0.18 protein:Tk03340 transcript:maker-scaffold870_size86522-snap-gene-0.18-mRNA-1 annotation:"nuclear pore complex protein"
MQPHASGRGRGAASPYSPFPFGSPLSRSRGSVLQPAAGDRIGAPSPPSPPSAVTTPKVRLRGQEMFGGPVVYGGANASTNVSAFLSAASSSATSNGRPPNNASLRRANRLLSSAPYHSAQRWQNRSARPAPPPSSRPSPEPSQTSFNLSATAKTILETLDQMSTPLRDALKIPVPRAEKRRALADEIMDGSGSSYVRRRPHLGGAARGTASLPNSATLNGPPLRKIFSPLPPASVALTPKTVQLAPRLVPKSPPKPPPPTEAAIATLETPKTSAGGKIRAKVGEKSKRRAEKGLFEIVPSSDPLASVEPPKLVVAKMPAFNFSRPISVTKADPERATPTARPITTSSSSSFLAKNQSILTNQLFNPVQDTPPPKKKNPTPTGVASRQRQFVFSQPKPIPRPITTSCSGVTRTFSFSAPDILTPSEARSPVVSNDAEELVHNQGQEITKLGNGSASNFSQLPDLTQASSVGRSSGMMFSNFNSSFVPKMKAGNVKDIRGDNNRLPDVASGISSAPSLKQGSVMDILAGYQDLKSETKR